MKLLADLSTMAMQMAYALVLTLFVFWVRGVEVTAVAVIEQTIVMVVLAVLLSTAWTVIYLARWLHKRFWGAA